MKMLRDRTKLCLATDVILVELKRQLIEKERNERVADYDPDDITNSANLLLGTKAMRKALKRIERILSKL